MSQEVVTRLRDDLDKSLGDDVATRQFCWGKSDFEFELNNANYELFREDYTKAYDIMEHWVKLARPAKPKRQSKPIEGNIKAYASRHGLDWRDADVRKAVRDWAVGEGIKVTGTRVPRFALTEYVAAHKLGG